MRFLPSARPLAVLLTFCLAGSLVGTAQAAPAKMSRKKAIWGPVEVAGKSQFPIYRDLGVGIYEYGLSWETVALKAEGPHRPRRPGLRLAAGPVRRSTCSESWLDGVLAA